MFVTVVCYVVTLACLLLLVVFLVCYVCVLFAGAVCNIFFVVCCPLIVVRCAVVSLLRCVVCCVVLFLYKFACGYCGCLLLFVVCCCGRSALLSAGVYCRLLLALSMWRLPLLVLFGVVGA